MKTYLATKNLVFPKLDKEVIVGETVELEESYAAEVNKNLKLTFPDVQAVLVPVDVQAVLVPVDGEATEPEIIEPETATAEPKKPGRKKTSKADDTEQVEEAAD